jgi:hypothetical protein
MPLMQEIKGIVMDLARDVAAATKKIQIASYLLYFFTGSCVNFHISTSLRSYRKRFQS